MRSERVRIGDTDVAALDDELDGPWIDVEVMQGSLAASAEVQQQSEDVSLADRRDVAGNRGGHVGVEVVCRASALLHQREPEEVESKRSAPDDKLRQPAGKCSARRQIAGDSTRAVQPREVSEASIAVRTGAGAELALHRRHVRRHRTDGELNR